MKGAQISHAHGERVSSAASVGRKAPHTRFPADTAVDPMLRRFARPILAGGNVPPEDPVIGCGRVGQVFSFLRRRQTSKRAGAAPEI